MTSPIAPAQPQEKVIVLLSGGMDSVTAFHHARTCMDVVATLSFDYGSRHNPRELPFAALHSRLAGVPNVQLPLGFIATHFDSQLLGTAGTIPKGHYEEASMKQTVVPFRNAIMLAIAAGFAESKGASGVVIAAHAGDHAIYPDCREDFMQAMNAAMQSGTYAKVSLIRPFIHLNKAAIAKRGFQLGIDFSTTWSCYEGGDTHCGTCGTCVERRESFAVAGIEDPTTYLSTAPLPPPPDVHR